MSTCVPFLQRWQLFLFGDKVFTEFLAKKNFTELLARCLPKEWLTPNALETQLAASGQAGVQPSNMAAVSFFFFFGPIFSLWARFLAAVSDIEDGNLANLSNQMLACLLLDGEQH